MNDNNEARDESMSLPDYEDTRSSNSNSQYGKMATNTRKRAKLVNYSGSSYNSDDTKNFPDPVPATSKGNQNRRPYNPNYETPNSKFSGNGNGAQGSRSAQVSPGRNRGPSASRGMNRGRSASRGSPGRGRRDQTRRDDRRWDRASELREEERDNRKWRY